MLFANDKRKCPVFWIDPDQTGCVLRHGCPLYKTGVRSVAFLFHVLVGLFLCTLSHTELILQCSACFCFSGLQKLSDRHVMRLILCCSDVGW